MNRTNKKQFTISAVILIAHCIAIVLHKIWHFNELMSAKKANVTLHIEDLKIRRWNKGRRREFTVSWESEANEDKKSALIFHFEFANALNFFRSRSQFITKFFFTFLVIFDSTVQLCKIQYIITTGCYCHTVWSNQLHRFFVTILVRKKRSSLTVFWCSSTFSFVLFSALTEQTSLVSWLEWKSIKRYWIDKLQWAVSTTTEIMTNK